MALGQEPSGGKRTVPSLRDSRAFTAPTDTSAPSYHIAAALRLRSGQAFAAEFPSVHRIEARKFSFTES